MPGPRPIPFVVGEYYHVYNRGIDKRIIFKSDNDYKRFIMLLYVANSKDSFRLDDLINKQHKTYSEILSLDRDNPLVSIGAWCLMTNHFHILLKEEVEGGITKFTKKFGTGFSMYFNIKHQRRGALFGSRFQSKHVGEDNYMRHLFGYVHLNPLDIKFSSWEELVDKQNPKEWRIFLEGYQYSSYQDYLGIERAEGNILNRSAFPEYFSKPKDFKDFIGSYLSFNPNL